MTEGEENKRGDTNQQGLRKIPSGPVEICIESIIINKYSKFNNFIIYCTNFRIICFYALEDRYVMCDKELRTIPVNGTDMNF